MRQEELIANFDKQAASYDDQWKRLAPLNGALHLLMRAVFSELPVDAHVLCVGAGTGAELVYLASEFPHWRFTAVEPSAAMLDVCKQRAEERGFASRCLFHRGYLDSLPPRTRSMRQPACSFRSSCWIGRRGRASSARSHSA